MKTRHLIFILSIFSFNTLSSQVPKTISYQGVLSDAEGEPLSDGQYVLGFALYDDAIAGNLLWEEDINTLVEGGVFSVILGESEALELPFDQAYWLGISIDGGEELSPRTALTAAPYSLGGKATELALEEAGEFKEGMFVEAGDTALYFVPTDKGMYIGPFADPPGLRKNENGTYRSAADFLHVNVETLRAFVNQGTSIDGGVLEGQGVNGSANKGDGVYGFAGEGVGVRGIANEGVGVLGESDKGHGVKGIGKGNLAGVMGESTMGKGVVGTSEMNVGVQGNAKSKPGVFGYSETQPGVQGQSLSLVGVYGESDEGIGVLGETKTNQDGVRGKSAQGIGVHGIALGEEGIGVKGVAERGVAVRGESKTNTGVFGKSEVFDGVRGVSEGIGSGVSGYSEDGVGVEGQGKIAGRFLGDVEIQSNGQLTIDRVDPEISDNFLVWGSDKVVKTRSLAEAISDLQGGGSFDGCLNNLDFKVTEFGEPVFRVFRNGLSNLYGTLIIEDQGMGHALIASSANTTIRASSTGSHPHSAVEGKALANGYGVFGSSQSGAGLYGSGPVGIQAVGDIAGQFQGDLYIEDQGRLKIDQVESKKVDNILVWDTDKFVKTRSLSEALSDIVFPDPFNGCLDNLDLKIKHVGDEVFTLNHQTGYTTLKGNVDVTSTSGVAVQGTSPTDYGVRGIGTGMSGSGVFGQSVEGIGVAASSVNNLGLDADGGTGIGLKATGAKAAGIFRGDVKIEPFGKLKISDVEPEESDNILVWAEDKYVKTRSLSEALADVVGGGEPFNGCLDNLDFKITTNEDPFFTVRQGGNAELKGTLTIEDQTIGAGLIVKGSLSGAILAEITSPGNAVLGEAKAGGFGVSGSSLGDIEGAGVLGFSDSGDGVFGQTNSSSTGAAGVYGTSSNGIGVIGSGGFAGGLFEGDVLIEEMGQLKIDRVDTELSDKLLVWADDKFVKTRSLNEAVQDLLPDDADMDPQNEIQELAISDRTISISQGNSILLPEDNDTDPNNEIQTITKDGPIIMLDKMGGTVQLEDDDDQNEIQKLSKDGAVITLDKNGESVTLMDDDPENELFKGTLNDQTLLVNFGGESTFQVNNDRCTFVDGALGVNGILDKPALTAVSENQNALYAAGANPGFTTAVIQHTDPNGFALNTIGNTVFSNATNSFVFIRPGQAQVAQFFGNVDVQGTFTALAKSFEIDHPLDPEKKKLKHFSIESDQLTNIYNGNAVLNENGEAVVKLPDWFEALNTDFSYQLTCIGGFANVYIAEEVENNQFKIGGGKPGLKVSWQVSGIRHDRQSMEIDRTVELDK